MRNPPKMLVVGATPPVEKPSLGGNERYLINLIELVRSMGVETAYVSDGAAGYEALYEQIEAAGAQRLRAPFCADPAQGAAGLDAAIQRIQPTLVLVNGHSGWLGPVVARSRRLAAVRNRVYTMHLPPSSLGAQIERPFHWTALLPGRWAARQRGADRRFLAAFDQVLTVSRSFGDLAVERGYLRREQVRFIPNGVDIERFHPAESERPDAVVRIGSACRLTEVKRVSLLVDAFRRLDPAAPAELHIAGEGPEEAALRSQVRSLGLDERVVFHGFRADVPQFLREIDILAITSDEEAAPYSQLEAMASGLPAVVTAVGDLPYILRDGVDGFLAPRGDVARVAEGLARLTADAELRRRMGEAARQRAVEEFSGEVWRRRMHEFIAQRLSSKAA